MSAELTPQSYVEHHLSYLTFNFSTNDFWTIHVDTMVMAVLMGALVTFFFWSIAKKPSINKPSKTQVFVEMVIEGVDQQVEQLFKGDRSFLSPLALTLFTWILMMNALDLIPLDFLGASLGWLLGDFYWKLVPTSDINLTFALSFSIFFLTIASAIQAKGVIGFIAEMFTSPFHVSNPIGVVALAIPNFLLNLVEHIARPVSLGMRLYGNMYASEILFLLIWMLASAGLVWMGLAYMLGTVWELFHILIVILQAFIFTILSVAYIAIVREKH